MKKNRLNDNNFLSELEKNEFKFVTIFVLIKFYFMSTRCANDYFRKYMIRLQYFLKSICQ